MTHLIFFMQLQQTSALLEGRLLLVEDGQLIDTYIATSGCPGHQAKSAQSEKGKGPLPGCYPLGIKSYQVSVTPVSLPNIPGVSGAFYAITPHTVNIGGVNRGDFGIHFDANVPGSAGCVVLRTPKGWQGFQQQMQRLKSKGLQQIPLIVSYS